MTYSRLSTHDGDDLEENEDGVGSLTPLDKTIDRIGMGNALSSLRPLSEC
jgi:hypothetical protein